MEVARKIINFTIAILAVIACFQIITINNNSLFSVKENAISECRSNIVSTIDQEHQYADNTFDGEENTSSL